MRLVWSGCPSPPQWGNLFQWFWSSVNLTGNQTKRSALLPSTGFGEAQAYWRSRSRGVRTRCRSRRARPPGAFGQDRGRSRLDRLPLPREDLVESEIDKPAEEVHEGVDGVGGAEMQDARSQDFPTYCAQCREKEGRPQAADNLSARNNPGQDVYVSGENDAAAKVGEMIVGKLVRQNAIQREGEPVDEVNEGGKQRGQITPREQCRP